MPRADSHVTKDILSQLETCSDETVQNLRHALGLAQNQDKKLIIDKSEVADRSNCGPTQTRKLDRVTTKHAPTQRPREACGHRIPILSASEKLILATKIVNFVLKNFSEQPPSSFGSQSDWQGLHERALNRQPCGQGTGTLCTKTSDKRGTNLALAQCGLLAFTVLSRCSLHAGEATESSTLQLEKGMLIFGTRLMSAQMTSETIRLLHLLRFRILQRIGSSYDSQMCLKAARHEATNIHKHDLASIVSVLLTFPDTKRFGTEASEVLLSYEILVLRFAAKQQSASVAEKLLTLLDPSSHISPAYIYEKRAVVCSGSFNKTLKDTETIAQLLQTMACNLATLTDVDAKRIGVKLLEVALQNWILVTKNTQPARASPDVWSAFTKYLLVLKMPPADGAQDLLTSIRSVFDELQRCLAEPGHIEPAPESVYMHLSHLALNAKDLNKAVMWTRDWRQATSPVKSNSVTGAIATIRLARISILSKNDILASLGNAKRSIGNELTGSASEFTMAFKETVGFRRDLTLDLNDAKTVVIDGLDLPSKIASLDFLCACARFYVKFIGHTPGTDTNIKTSQNYSSTRCQLIADHVAPLTEAILNLTRALLVSNQLSWPRISRVMDDCLTLPNVVTKDCAKECRHSLQEDVTQERIRLRVSEVCWSYYESKKEDSDCNDRLLSLQKSCDVLKTVRIISKGKGSLPLKLHRLGRLWRKMCRRPEALTALSECLSVSRDLGCLDEIGNKVLTGSIAKIHETGTCVVFFSALKTWIEIKLGEDKIDDDGRSAHFDDDTLEASARGALLEWQLSHLQSVNLRSHCVDLTRQAILRTGLDVYSQDKFPLRRKRLLIGYLNYHSHSFAISTPIRLVDVAEQLTRQTNHSYGLDRCLASHACFLDARLNICVAIHRPSNIRENFDRALSIWQRAFCDNIDGESKIRKLQDAGSWLQDLNLVSDFFRMTGGSAELMKCYKLQQDVSLLMEGDSCLQNRVQASIHVADLLLNLGYLKEARNQLDQVAADWNGAQGSMALQNDMHLVEAQYYLFTGDRDERCVALCGTTMTGLINYSARHIRAFHPVGLEDSLFDAAVPAPFTKMWQIIQSTISEADVLFVKSLLNLETYGLDHGLLLAKKCLFVLQHCWRSLDQLRHPKNLDYPAPVVQENAIAKAIGSLSIDKQVQDEDRTNESAPVPAFWPLAWRMRRTQSLTSVIAQRVGSLQDASGAADQALKLAVNCESVASLASAQLLLADVGCRSQRDDLGWSDFEKAAKHFENDNGSADLINHHCTLGNYYHSQKNFQKEMEEYMIATKIWRDITSPSFIQSLSEQVIFAPKPKGQSSLQRTEQDITVKQSFRANRDSKKRTGNCKSKQTLTEGAEIQCELLNILGNIDRSRAECLLSQQDVHGAVTLLGSLSLLSGKEEERAQAKATWSSALLHQATTALAKDAVLSMISESTIAYPVVSMIRSRSYMDVDIDAKGIDAYGADPTWNSAGRGGSRNAKHSAKGSERQPRDKDFSSDPGSTMSQAFNNAFEVITKHRRTCSNITALRAWTVLTSTSMALTLPRIVPDRQPLHPQLMAYLMEFPKNLATVREQALTRVGKTFKSDFSNERYEAVLTNSSQDDGINLFKQFSRALPSTWTVLSISLSEDKNYLYFSRYNIDRQPFILRLPLRRQHAEDTVEGNEETFTFEDAQTTLHEIIHSSDETVSAARNAPELLDSKEAKGRWWAKREQLDREMQDLLSNMETMWLGGFRGVFSPKQVYTTLLAQFQKSFDNILAKHLLSRQKLRKDADVIKLDLRVYELFVQLGPPGADDDNFEDLLTDLLYFIVDILQFYNEPNAYDEIDFDAMIVEITDALHCYHNAEQLESLNSTQSHLILVLDKHLHVFPWESMPCLENRSVSRVNSLVELRERILVMQTQQHNAASTTSGIRATRKHGTTILNPSGDLKKTQTRFEKPLASLEAWTNIIAREPLEMEFEAALTPKEHANDTTISTDPCVVLYFGHGSGLQYIRNKRIKVLRLRQDSSPTTTPRPDGDACRRGSRHAPTAASSRAAIKPTCATTLLFGCSSALLHPAGEFEPYGTPKTFLLAGAPAVLGALWDVTDGDVDVFAKGVLVQWGLVEEGTFGKEEARKRGRLFRRRGKGMRKNKEEEEKEKDDDGGREVGVALSEAAARSRGKCYLKYLNGAAMVVYGVPVYLGD